MTWDCRRNFLRQPIYVTQDRLRVQDIFGYGYSISDAVWKAELCLPDEYDANQLGIRNLWESDRFVSWPEIDMILNQNPAIIPIGWRVYLHLYQNQEQIPTSWLEILTGGDVILFPYAVCYFRKPNGADALCCAAFRYDQAERVIECIPINRWVTGATSPIAVYYRES